MRITSITRFLLQVLFLLSKTNDDWWNVRKANGDEGFVPANYVREGQPKKINVHVKKEVRVPKKKMVPKTKMVKQTIKVKKRKPKAPRRFCCVFLVTHAHAHIYTYI